MSTEAIAEALAAYLGDAAALAKQGRIGSPRELERLSKRLEAFSVALLFNALTPKAIFLAIQEDMERPIDDDDQQPAHEQAAETLHRVWVECSSPSAQGRPLLMALASLELLEKAECEVTNG